MGVKFCGLAIFCVLQELIFAILKDWFFLLEINFCDFLEVAFKWNYSLFRFLSKRPLKGIEIQIKQHGNVTLLHYNGSKITSVPRDVLSTELSMAFSPSNQYFCISFLQWSKFLRRKKLR